MSELESLERDMVKGIAEEIEAIADGRAYTTEDDPYNIIYCEDADDVPEDAEQASMYDYFADTYGTRYVVNDDLAVVGVMVMVACGGPNIWVDSYAQEVRLHWGSDTVSFPLTTYACNEIDEWAREAFSCRIEGAR